MCAAGGRRDVHRDGHGGPDSGGRAAGELDVGQHHHRLCQRQWRPAGPLHERSSARRREQIPIPGTISCRIFSAFCLPLACMISKASLPHGIHPWQRLLSNDYPIRWVSHHRAALVSHEPLGRWHSFTFGIEMCGVCVCVQKHTFFEGGVRVMALVSGPLIPAARRENEPRTP